MTKTASTRKPVGLRLRFVQAWVDDDGRAHHYFRRAGFKRVRLPGLVGSDEFIEAYRAALASAPEPIGGARARAGSVSAAIASYFASSSFKRLGTDTQAVRRAVLEVFRREHGDKPIRPMPRKFVAAYLEAMQPSTAKNYLKALRAVAQHGVAEGMLDDDPTLGIKLGKMNGDGRHTWTEDELAQFEAHHPIGSRERLAYTLGICTGQRRGDVTRMGRQHIRGDNLAVTQQKTGRPLVLPIHAELRAVLDLVPATQMTFLLTLRGTPFTDHAFSDWFGKACDAAGLPSCCTFHGLRKAVCRRLAEAGCTVHEIAAISGHATLKEIERYTKAADQVRLARAAMARTAMAKKGAA